MFLQQWYEVVASYLLEGPRPPRLATSHQDSSPAARLDPSVFRTKRATHKAKHSKEQQSKEHTKTKDQTKDKHKEQAREQMNSKDKEHVKGDSTKEKEATKEQVVTAAKEQQLTLEQQSNETTKDGRHNGAGHDQGNDQQTKDACKDSPADQDSRELRETNSVNGTSKKEDEKATEEKSEVKE